MYIDLECIIESEVSQRKTNTMHQCIHMESREMVQMNLVPGQE